MICFFAILFLIAGLYLAFLVLVHKPLQFLAEDPSVVAAHLGAAHKTSLVALDTDHAFRRKFFCCHGIRLMSTGRLVNDKF
jgi:hypothetical protein